MRSGTFELNGVIGEGARTALEIMDLIQKLDPKVYAWLNSPTRTRGPRPLCDAKVAQLIDEARAALGV